MYLLLKMLLGFIARIFWSIFFITNVAWFYQPQYCLVSSTQIPMILLQYCMVLLPQLPFVFVNHNTAYLLISLAIWAMLMFVMS